MAKKKAVKPSKAPTSPPKAKARPNAPPVADWLPVLRQGPAGVRRWNRQTLVMRGQTDLDGAELASLDLEGIVLTGVKAEKVGFQGARLAGAKATNAKLPAADFSGAILTDADLTGADLKKAKFDGADLSRAVLIRAQLQGADLAGATLIDTKLEGASFDKATTWPAGFVIPAELIFTSNATDPRLAGKGKTAAATDINGMMTRLYKLIDAKRMKRVLDMLKSGKNQFFAEVDPTYVRGIVRSQKDEDAYYSCVMLESGVYTCSDPGVHPCLGLSNEPCKHILVLLIGLARAGEIDPAVVDRWIVASKKLRTHRWNKTTKNHVSETLLRYKGVQAGDVDWRPTETIPEDFYAF